jgi:hypothetical protein
VSVASWLKTKGETRPSRDRLISLGCSTNKVAGRMDDCACVCQLSMTGWLLELYTCGAVVKRQGRVSRKTCVEGGVCAFEM